MMRPCLLLFVAAFCNAGQAPPLRAPLAIETPVQDKNFYLLSRMERLPSVRDSISHDKVLIAVARSRVEGTHHAAESCKLDLDCYSAAFRWTDDQQTEIADALSSLYKQSAAVRNWVDGELRASGAYIRYGEEDGAALLAKAWRDCARGINLSIDTYGLGKQGRYPAIDSVTYDPKSNGYERVVEGEATLLAEQADAKSLFFELSLRFALDLMALNNRDEAGRFEPLETGENAAAIARIKTLDWARYPYTAIVVPGAGNDRPGVRLSAAGKLRDDIAADRYRSGRAPFVLVSGGFVHPSQTEYAEALEMKRDLISRLRIPPEAILIDPHARHTTTNLRNAARLLYRYGMPFDRKALITTDAGQSKYIESEVFVKRCRDELGYLPYRLPSRTSVFDLEFFPDIQSLQIDPNDLLDP